MFGLLNAILDLDRPIIVVEILNPFSYQEFAESKLIVLDMTNEKRRSATTSGRYPAPEKKGERLGIEKGKLAGKIQMLQELLGEPVADDGELSASVTEALLVFGFLVGADFFH